MTATLDYPEDDGKNLTPNGEERPITHLTESNWDELTDWLAQDDKKA